MLAYVGVLVQLPDAADCMLIMHYYYRSLLLLHVCTGSCGRSLHTYMQLQQVAKAAALPAA